MLKYNAKEILKFAMSTEQEGVDFYNDLSKKLSGDLKAKMIQFANEEKAHFVTFSNWYDLLSDDGDDYLFDAEVSAYFASQAQNEIFNNRNLKTNTLGEILELAFETEKKTIEFYEKLLDQTDSENHSILLKIIKEEKLHYDKLVDFKLKFGDTILK